MLDNKMIGDVLTDLANDGYSPAFAEVYFVKYGPNWSDSPEDAIREYKRAIRSFKHQTQSPDDLYVFERYVSDMARTQNRMLKFLPAEDRKIYVIHQRANAGL